MDSSNWASPWWETDQYGSTVPTPAEFERYAGPKGPAFVRAFEDGRTDPGWGLTPSKPGAPSFMPQYTAGRFGWSRVKVGYDQERWAFAFVMRSMRLVCIDIDGKNSGFQSMHLLGPLPPTLAETSKSGNGLHLFYFVDDVWDDTVGFGRLSDRIGIVPGVDIRATGCVYHHPQQRWNNRLIARLPAFVENKLVGRQEKLLAREREIRLIVSGGDRTEIEEMHEDLMMQLAQPVPAGRRNNTLFAIGTQMKLAGVPEWENHVTRRAKQLGLDTVESTKLVANITKYGTDTP